MWRRPFPLPRPPLGSLPSPIFFLFWPRFLPFSPTARAWSRANDGYTMTLEKLPLKDKIIALCLQHIIVNYKTKMNIEKLWGQKVFQNHNKNLFQSSSSLFIPASFCIFCIFIPSSNSFWAVILEFYSIWYSWYQRISLRADRTFVGRRPKTRAWPKPKTAHEKPLVHRVSIYWQGWGEV